MAQTLRMLSLIPRLIWASPWTLFGICCGLLGYCTGGSMGRTGRVLEFWGGGLPRMFRLLPFVTSADAVTFGHTVLARDRQALDATREHEFVHVRQYERWGLFFIPAYLLSSLFVRLRGGHPYWDNPFEQEAYRTAP